MRQHWSVLMLLARSSFLQILAVLVLMGAVQATLFCRVLAGTAVSLEETLANSGAVWACGVGFLLVTALLCRTGCNRGSRQEYTLRRLGVSEKALFFWQAGYNAGVYLVFWAAQVAILLLLSALYCRAGQDVSPQAVFLGFYRSPFLHSFLPLGEVSMWCCNFVVILCLGICAAAFPVRQRRGERGTAIVVLEVTVLFLFQRQLGNFSGSFFLALIAFTAGLTAWWGVFRKEENYDRYD